MLFCLGAAPQAGALSLTLPGPGAEIVAAGVVRENGASRRGITVAVFANPTSAALDRVGTRGLRMLPIGLATTNSMGRFVIATDLEALPGEYRGPRGEVDYTVIVGNRRALSWSETVFPTGAPVDGYRAPAATKENLALAASVGGSRIASLHFDLARGTAWTSADDPSHWVDSQGRELGLARGQAAARTLRMDGTGMLTFARQFMATDRTYRSAALAVPGCGQSFWTSDYKKNIKEHFTTGWSVKGVPVTVTMGASSSHSLGIVLSDGGALSAGGTKSITHQSLVTQNNVIDAHASNRVNYRKKVVVCQGDAWLPYSFYGALSDFDRATHVNFSECITRLANSTWSTGTARNATRSAGVTFPGLSVSAQSGYGSSVDMTFNFTVRGKICGNSSRGPAQSSLVSAQR